MCLSAAKGLAMEKPEEFCPMEKPWKYGNCGKGFYAPSDLETHWQSHQGEALHCPECGKTFTQASHLLTHWHIHTGERTSSCPEYGKAFSNSSALMIHRWIHTGERPFSCPE